MQIYATERPLSCLTLDSHSEDVALNFWTKDIIDIASIVGIGYREPLISNHILALMSFLIFESSIHQIYSFFQRTKRACKFFISRLFADVSFHPNPRRLCNTEKTPSTTYIIPPSLRNRRFPSSISKLADNSSFPFKHERSSFCDAVSD